MARYHDTCTLGNYTFVIRSAEPEDAERVIAHVRQVDTESVFLSREPGEFAMTMEEEAAYLQKARDTELGLYLVAETEGRIIATCAASIDSHLRERHKARFGIAVQRAYWSMGIGRKLMEALIGWCRERGLVKIELTVDTENQRALSLYGSLGFVTEGTLRKTSRLGDGSYRNAYAMALFLDNERAEA
ncbi:MAG: GNAT family N-acetyltransferase [Clostridiaceae bacterium]|nr:GNAT family N-acetyltransferase [Clostridiaceae bacterium]